MLRTAGPEARRRHDEDITIRRQALQTIADIVRNNWLADTSRDTAYSAIKQWQRFCAVYSIDPCPAEGVLDRDLALYSVHLAATRLVKYKTIKNYISMGVRVLCLATDCPWTDINKRPVVWQTLRGLRRLLGDEPQQKLGISLDMLCLMRKNMNLTSSEDATLWAAFLVGFYGMFRKGNLTAKRSTDFNPREDLRRMDLLIEKRRVVVRIRHSKVIQFGETVLYVQLPFIANNPDLCPVQALAHMMRLAPGKPEDPLFKQGLTSKPLTHARFVGRLKELIRSIGIDERQYAGHSFRRGGASWAHSIGISDALIKLQGDWHSDAYLLYIHITDEAKQRAIDKMVLAADAITLGWRS